MLAPALTLIVEAPRDDSASELAALRGLLTAISSSSPVMGADARECAEVAYLLLQVISGCPRNLCRAVSLDFCQGVEYVATAKIEEGFAKIVTHGTKLGTTKAPKKKTKKKERVQVRYLLACCRLGSHLAVFVAEHPVPNAHPLTHRSRTLSSWMTTTTSST